MIVGGVGELVEGGAGRAHHLLGEPMDGLADLLPRCR